MTTARFCHMGRWTSKVDKFLLQYDEPCIIFRNDEQPGPAQHISLSITWQLLGTQRNISCNTNTSDNPDSKTTNNWKQNSVRFPIQHTLNIHLQTGIMFCHKQSRSHLYHSTEAHTTIISQQRISLLKHGRVAAFYGFLMTRSKY